MGLKKGDLVRLLPEKFKDEEVVWDTRVTEMHGYLWFLDHKRSDLDPTVWVCRSLATGEMCRWYEAELEGADDEEA